MRTPLIFFSQLRRGLICTALLACAMLGATPVHAQQDTSASLTITVAAGAFDRHGTVVFFAPPTALPAGRYVLEGPSGRSVPLQVSGQEAWFVLDTLAAGATRSYQLTSGAAAVAADTSGGVRLEQHEGALALLVGERPALQYWLAPRPLPRPDLDAIYRRGGYVHPIRTPSGRVVTGDYPADHPHHHGLWAAWTNTQFRGRTPDFWNMQKGTGAVMPMALDSAWGGPVHGGFRARHRYEDYSGPEPVTALYEQWTLRLYAAPPRPDSPGSDPDYHLFDLVVEQATASASPLVLPTYHYGGVALRGRDAWHGAEGARFLTSEGKTRADGNATRARWTYMGGDVDGEQAGVAMLSHPANVRAPQPVRIHPEMPYFCFAPTQLGPWTLRPGQPYQARYRLVAFDGPPDAEALDRLWNDYAYPPAVTVETSSSSGRAPSPQ